MKWNSFWPTYILGTICVWLKTKSCTASNPQKSCVPNFRSRKFWGQSSMLMRLTPQLGAAFSPFPTTGQPGPHVRLITKNHKIKINQNITLAKTETEKKAELLPYFRGAGHTKECTNLHLNGRRCKKGVIISFSLLLYSFFEPFLGLVSLAMNATNGLIRLGATTSWGAHICLWVLGHRVHKKPGGMHRLRRQFIGMEISAFS